MKKLKNLIILFPSFGTGGVTNNLINFTNFCAKKKINIYLVSNISQTEKKLFNKKFVKFVTIKNIFFLNKDSRVLTSLASINKLLKLFYFLKSTNTVVFSFQSHILPIIICKIFSWKIIIRNSEDPLEATKFADSKFFAYFTLLLKFLIYRFSNGIITNSHRSKKSLEKLVKNKTKLIFNPYLEKIHRYKKTKRKDLILSVGRLCKQKNQSDIIKAFKIFIKKYPKFKLIIIGHGTDYKKLKNLSYELKLEKKIKFLGRKTKVKEYFVKSKIFVFPSLYEGLPNVLIDSLNYNLPVISSNCSGAKDILGNDFKDFVPHRNYRVLAKKMIQVIDKYNSKISTMTKIRKNLYRFMVKNQSIRYLNYCNEIL